MRIKVSDGKKTGEYEFSAGIPASDAIAALGFDFPMPCGGKGRCGKCVCKINGRSAPACGTLLFTDSEILLPSAESAVLTAEQAVVPDADGVVIDIGTTTLAAALFENGRPVKTVGRRNPQCAYGADVISRISAEGAPLTEAIRSAVRELRENLGTDRKTVITGNTVMLALYAGMDVSQMGAAPFPMPSRFDCELDGAYLPPCLSAFVGADALCSLMWSGADEANGSFIVADLGTNSEIALVSGGEIFFTSAAAGPALEGGNISRGTAAVDGAIFRVCDSGFETIGGGEPCGICGSGLVDAMSVMLESGFMDRFGTIEHDFRIPNSDIFITQQDVRAYQLCKAAISAAMKILLDMNRLSIDNIDRIFLSGALGGSINVKNAAATGLLPNVAADKFTAVGNGALMGGALLLNEHNRERARRIAADAKAVNIAADSGFNERYIAEMNFEV